MKLFTKILIANRGEIAVRIVQTARKMGIQTVAVYTYSDRNSLHSSLADEAVLLEGDHLSETYLNWSLLIRIAKERKAEAIHPGYGFLAENALFAEAVAEAGFIFIGPSPEQIRLMGEKIRASRLVGSLQVPVLEPLIGNKTELREKARGTGFPLIVKASAGGGGKGMIVVFSENELPAALDKVERQALEYFNNGELFIEKYTPNARHIEVQVLGDQYGALIHLYERECSIQRRFQKIVEEAPSAFVNERLRNKICLAALKIAQSVGYQGLGTVEFLVDENGDYRFLEMNTRIQVEHPVTEAVTGIDLVEQQLLVAAGNPLQIKQSDVALTGHAVEVRICAEDAENDFRPSTGVIEKFGLVKRDGLQWDTFVQEGTVISAQYDSLLCKLIAHAPGREQAIDRIRQGLRETVVLGLQSNIPFLLQLLDDSRFRENEISTSFLNRFSFQSPKNVAPVAAAYLLFHFFRNKNEATNLWQNIGFWRQALSFTLWVDEQATEFGTIQKTSWFELHFQDKKYAFTQNKWNGDSLVLTMNGLSLSFFIRDKETETRIFFEGKEHSLRSNLVVQQIRMNKEKQKLQDHFRQEIKSELFGKVVSLEVTTGDRIREGVPLLALESMKTEFRILCPQPSIVKKVHVSVGEAVKDGQLLVELRAL